MENRATYRITEKFYFYLSKGLDTDVALQKAKIDFIKTVEEKEKTLPWYWASLILTGKTEALPRDQSFPDYRIYAILLTAALLLLFLHKKYLNKKRTG